MQVSIVAAAAALFFSTASFGEEIFTEMPQGKIWLAKLIRIKGDGYDYCGRFLAISTRMPGYVVYGLQTGSLMFSPTRLVDLIPDTAASPPFVHYQLTLGKSATDTQQRAVIHMTPKAVTEARACVPAKVQEGGI